MYKALVRTPLQQAMVLLWLAGAWRLGTWLMLAPPDGRWVVSAGAGALLLMFIGARLRLLMVVPHGVLGMSRALCPDAARATIAALAAAVILLSGQAWMQLAVVALGGLAGLRWCRDAQPVAGGGLPLRYGPRLGAALLALCALLLVALPLIARDGGNLLAVFDAFYRAGALVFGGGQEVAQLLEGEVHRIF